MLGVLVVSLLFAFYAAIADMVRVWSNQADYSHGFLVPLFSAYLLWIRRSKLPPLVEWPEYWGLLPIVLAVALSSWAGMTNIAKEFCQGVSLILALGGVVALLLGRAGLHWAWPSLAFLIFMVKLPDRFEILFTFKLRQIATTASNFLLQTIGYPSYIAGQGGTVINVGDVRLGVEWACSGLSMVLTFVAIGTAMALLITRPIGDRIFVVLTTIPISIVSNIIRITITALVYIAGWHWLGDKIVHDFAGWLMMPFALAFLWLELKLIDWLFVVPEAPDRDDILKSATATAAAQWVVPEQPNNDKNDLPPATPKPTGVAP